jgi:reductive dehalogenase
MLIGFLILGAVGLAVQALIGLSFLISSIWENEKRATTFAWVQFIGMVLLLAVYLYLAKIGFFNTPAGGWLLGAGYIVTILGLIFFLRKTAANTKALEGTKGNIVDTVNRFDEREVLFARNRSLRPGSPQYDIFYKEHPEYKTFDDARRAKGGPMGHPGIIDGVHGTHNVAMMFGGSSIPQFLGVPDCVNPKPHFSIADQIAKNPVKIDPTDMTLRIKGFAKRLGAAMVGITELNQNWVYSHRGEIFHENWEDWGQEINLDHKYAIVFAEEMEFDLVQTAPHTPTNIESMYNYAQGAFITSQVAAYIANLGYNASANHLRHYDALMVPLAVDAGLGELSRMGYLLTKDLGPRIRLSAVTTDIPLVTDKPVDIGAEDFCKICKKCARCCPSQSIPLDDPQVVNGTRRWTINAQTCFDYWGKIGTDCNICMRVCPWSHARTFPHRLIVSMITRNAAARRLFNIMDDIFYGKKPKSQKGPDWARFSP